MFEFMKKTNEGNGQNDEMDFNINLSTGNNTILNQPITCEEIMAAVKKW